MLKALLSDVQGTATDFHSTICDEARRMCGDVDWPEVVRRWRAGYFAALGALNPPGPGCWVSVQSVYRNALDIVLTDAGVTDFTDAERDELTLAWQRLRPWPDVVPGLTRLRSRYTREFEVNACDFVDVADRLVR